LIFQFHKCTFLKYLGECIFLLGSLKKYIFSIFVTKPIMDAYKLLGIETLFYYLKNRN